jgi:C4-dicarboxylate-specific signal transduction histidine kinase
MSDVDAWRARFERERAARREAEDLLHAKSRELWAANQALEARAAELATSLQRLEEARDALVQREKLAALGGLVAGIAHEINTPLGVAVTAVSHGEDRVKTLAERSASGQVTRGELRTLVSDIGTAMQLALTNLQRAAALVRSFKKVAVDQSSEESREANLGEVLADVLTSLAPILRRARVEVRLLPTPSIPTRADVGALAQIVTNLVQNACVHAFDDLPDPHVIEVELVDAGDAAIVAVRDNGRGMTEDVRARVYEPFFTTRRGAGGSGLGLHILHTLVTQRFGGTIELRTAPGEGTSWTLRLPFGSPTLSRLASR